MRLLLNRLKFDPFRVVDYRPSFLAMEVRPLQGQMISLIEVKMIFYDLRLSSVTLKESNIHATSWERRFSYAIIHSPDPEGVEHPYKILQRVLPYAIIPFAPPEGVKHPYKILQRILPYAIIPFAPPDPEGVKHPYKGPAKGLPHNPRLRKKLFPFRIPYICTCPHSYTPYPSASDLLNYKLSNETTIPIA